MKNVFIIAAVIFTIVLFANAKVDNDRINSAVVMSIK